jgi:riboflavin kinase/FMN adenylyltransferase
MQSRSVIRRVAPEDLAEICEPLSLALGVFDGIHLGHQAVIHEAVLGATSSQGLSGVVTFDPHPIAVLAPERAPRRLLANLEHKERILAELGVDILVVVPFTADFARQEPEEFLETLASAPRLHRLSMGTDWRFGKNRRGDQALLEEFGETRNVEIRPVTAVMSGGERISSTRIRQALRDGNLAAAEEMLGRPYSVMGEVKAGRKLGRTIGFSTANLVPGQEQLPPNGVWAVDARWGEEWHPAVANLGRRPTVDNDLNRLLEVHLLDWEGDLYDRMLEVRFKKFLRSEEKFDGIEALKAQIARDVHSARQEI